MVKTTKRRGLKASIHPSIDHALNSNYHFDYSSLYSQFINDSWMNQSLQKLYDMAGVHTRPLLCSSSENARTAVDVINYKFVTSAIGDKPEYSKHHNLVDTLKAVLTEAQIPREQIECALGSFDQNVTIGEYQSRHLMSIFHVQKGSVHSRPCNVSLTNVPVPVLGSTSVYSLLGY